MKQARNENSVSDMDITQVNVQEKDNKVVFRSYSFLLYFYFSYCNKKDESLSCVSGKQI
jgi:hypothetical protein